MYKIILDARFFSEAFKCTKASILITIFFFFSFKTEFTHADFTKNLNINIMSLFRYICVSNTSVQYKNVYLIIHSILKVYFFMIETKCCTVKPIWKSF